MMPKKPTIKGIFSIDPNRLMHDGVAKQLQGISTAVTDLAHRFSKRTTDDILASIETELRILIDESPGNELFTDALRDVQMIRSGDGDAIAATARLVRLACWAEHWSEIARAFTHKMNTKGGARKANQHKAARDADGNKAKWSHWETVANSIREKNPDATPWNLAQSVARHVKGTDHQADARTIYRHFTKSADKR
jgi:hypothetical protein